MSHEFKTHLIPFAAVWAGDKKAEFRDLSDRPNLIRGDFLTLREYNEITDEYTGRLIKAQITHIQRGYGIPGNHALLSLDVVHKQVIKD